MEHNMEQFSHYNTSRTNSNNRVYINRNFNKTGQDGLATVSNSNVMYFNPNFSQKASTNLTHMTQQRDHTIRPKIHVNPNFIRPKAQDIPSNSSHINNLPNTTINRSYNPIMNVLPVQTVTDNRKNIVLPTISKSRYCLVRHTEKVVKSPSPTSVSTKSIQPTVKLNKYKLVSLSSMKSSLSIDSKKPIVKAIPSTQTKFNLSNISRPKYKIGPKSPLSLQNSRFRFIKRNSALLNPAEGGQSKIRRVSITHSKYVLKSSFRQTKKIIPGALKKNNIPCPLFKKYGKCLRMVQGHCDFLHDRKHVSICRKFLKGACHDKHCLLSHDLTDKKMPTCYFYLQGNCTKEGCPYLHVKLNEKTKICPDFLRGYCENGDKCLHRHVNITLKNKPKSKNVRKRGFSTSMNKTSTEKTKVHRKRSDKEDNLPGKSISTNVMESVIIKDQRYFKDVTGDKSSEEQYDCIKPTRCKLGTLPSFIQL